MKIKKNWKADTVSLMVCLPKSEESNTACPRYCWLNFLRWWKCWFLVTEPIGRPLPRFSITPSGEVSVNSPEDGIEAEIGMGFKSTLPSAPYFLGLPLFFFFIAIISPSALFWVGFSSFASDDGMKLRTLSSFATGGGARGEGEDVTGTGGEGRREVVVGGEDTGIDAGSVSDGCGGCSGSTSPAPPPVTATDSLPSMKD